MRYFELMENKNTDVEKMFGRILFGTFRQKSEVDTKAEAQIFSVLYNWIAKGSRKNFNKTIVTLNKYKDYFPGLLAPTNKTIYRGLRISISAFKKLNLQSGKWYTTQIQYKPKYKMEAWTTTLDTAISVAVGGVHHKGDLNKIAAETNEILLHDYYGNEDYPEDIAVILKINSNPDEMVLTPKLTNLIALVVVGEEENEIIRASTKSISATLLVHPNWVKAIEKLDKRKPLTLIAEPPVSQTGEAYVRFETREIPGKIGHIIGVLKDGTEEKVNKYSYVYAVALTKAYNNKIAP